MVFFSQYSYSGTSDYKKLAYIDETVLFGLGLSYSKLEMYTDVGNYFSVSNANPRLDVRFISKVEQDFRSLWQLYYVREHFQTENPNLSIRNNKDLNRYGLVYKPYWFSENKNFSYGFNIQVKQADIYASIPDTSHLYGTLEQRISYQLGASLKWYGQTVAKLPLCLDFDFSYINHFTQNANFDYGEGFAYRMAVDFDFGRRSYFSNYSISFFYENEKIQTDLKPFIEKELGFNVAKAISF